MRSRPALRAVSNFNPRTPCGVRRPPGRSAFSCSNISIHAPRAGCDNRRSSPGPSDTRHFNPRTPCGVRPIALWPMVAVGEFQSTHPVRGATVLASKSWMMPKIFQSTHPVRGATLFDMIGPLKRQISIHAPRAGCDVSGTSIWWAKAAFQSTHPVRGATTPDPITSAAFHYFNPRTPCGVRPKPWYG